MFELNSKYGEVKVYAETIDESPFAYKDMEEIIKAVEPTVDIVERIIPIYNYKATS